MSNKLKFGNGTFATKKGSTLAYNDENDNYKPLPFTTTRASGATRVNKEGLIEVVENDRPRIDYTDSAKGALLLEPSRTNLNTYSEDFSNAAWTKSAATVVITSNVAPDGTTNSVYNLTGTNANLYTGGTTGVEHTISVYAKSNGQGKDSFKLRLGNSISSSNTVTDEWVRYEFTATPTTSVFGLTVDSSPNNQWDILIWGAQLEESSYPTSYIPTQGATATRLADTASGSGNSEVFNDSEGVLMVETKFLENGRIGISNSDNSDEISIGLAGSIFYRIRENNASVITEFTGSSEGENHKFALKYNSQQTSIFVDGFELNTNSTSYSLSGLNELSFIAEASVFYGNTKQIQYYNTILTDAELETLTSYSSLSELVTELNLNTL